MLNGRNIEVWCAARLVAKLEPKQACCDKLICRACATKPPCDRNVITGNAGKCSRLNYGSGTMCDKCVDIDKAIERFRNVQRSILDQVTLDRAKEMIAELEAKKVALHPS
jgi:hypothetical protein